MILALSMSLFAVIALAVIFVPLGIALRSHWKAQHEWNALFTADDLQTVVEADLEYADAA